MIDRNDFREGMEVLGSDGEGLGRIVDVEGHDLKLTSGLTLPISRVERVRDGRVHLSDSAAVVRGGLSARVAEATGDPMPTAPAPAGGRPWLWIGALIAFLIALALYYVLVIGKEREELAAPPRIEAGPVSPVGLGDQAATGGVEGLAAYLGGAEPAGRTFTLDRLNFATGSAALPADAGVLIDQVAQAMRAHPNARVRVVGYADARGAAPANADLGLRRAGAVATALGLRGVERTRVETASGGEGNPEAPNATPQGRSENRRTELVVTAK